MEEDNLKARIRRMFRSRLRSCKSKEQIFDVVLTHRRQLEETKIPFLSPVVSGRKCPPASPAISAFNKKEEKFRHSLAVVKRSSDPYNDFRLSMVEMIVENNISAKDMDNLLRCFLSLNSHHHHKVIIQVFAEIWEAFFSHH